MMRLQPVLRKASSPLLAAIVCAAGIALSPVGASAKDAPETATGKIKEFSCGDNCYLTITPEKKGEDLTGLCVADACEEWNANTVMPDELVGKRVRVTIGTGQQVDGNGTVMGDFPSFTEIEFLDK